MKIKLSGLRWWIVAMLLMVTVVNYLNRSCLAVSGPTFKKELFINEQQFSYIVMAFQLSYLIMQPFTGRIIDWLNIRLGFTLAIIWYSIAQMLTIFAGGWKSLMVMRALLGIGEAGNFPGAIKTVSIWFKPKERTIATGILNVGSSLGAMVAPPLVAYCILTFNWRAAFIVTGIISAAWGVLWLLFYHEPEKHPFIKPNELEEIRRIAREDAAQDAHKETGVWKIILPNRNFWGIAIARFFNEPAWQFITYWIPLYLATERHLNLKQIGYFAWVPFLAGDLGCIFGGMLSPFFMKIFKNMSLITSRKLSALVNGVLMIGTVGIGLATTPLWAVFFFCVGSFFHQSMSITLLTLSADLFPSRTVATTNGLTGAASHFGGMLFTLTVGYVVMHVGYKPLFPCMAAFDIIGAILLCLIIKQTMPQQGSMQHASAPACGGTA
jgi:ACS family hexuronate transporter-like MFS transporter